MVFGFWNIDGNMDLGSLLIDFATEYGIEILILAEAKPSAKRAKSSNSNDVVHDFLYLSQKSEWIPDFSFIHSPNDRLKVLTSYDPKSFSCKNKLFKNTRMLAFRVNIPEIIEFNLFPIHFHSKDNWSEISLAMECVTLSNDIKKVEEEEGSPCRNSIVMGDLNMNPFEPGMVAANGVNAVADLDFAFEKKGRVVDKTMYPYFYNPMWNFLGDHGKPLGSYHYPPAGQIGYKWHVLDQVLLRPQFKPYLHPSSVKIVTKIGEQVLHDKDGYPDRRFSDHFPLVLELKK